MQWWLVLKTVTCKTVATSLYYSCGQPWDRETVVLVQSKMCRQYSIAYSCTGKPNCCFSKLFGYYSCMNILPMLI